MADILYRIVIYPLELIIEVIFCVLYRIFNDPGICLIGVSIAVSVLTLPMYNMADRIQSEDNKKRESMDDMLKKECLYVVNFSDFQMDSFDGHFAGEIRLAYYYDGKGNVECVTGGSVNGSIFDTQGELVFSSELQKRADFEGPKACVFKNVSVAGEE